MPRSVLNEFGTMLKDVLCAHFSNQMRQPILEFLILPFNKSFSLANSLTNYRVESLGRRQ